MECKVLLVCQWNTLPQHVWKLLYFIFANFFICIEFSLILQKSVNESDSVSWIPTSTSCASVFYNYLIFNLDIYLFMSFINIKKFREAASIDIYHNNLVWRNTKSSVQQEFSIPPLVDDLILLNFSPIESIIYKYIYRLDKKGLFFSLFISYFFCKNLLLFLIFNYLQIIYVFI